MQVESFKVKLHAIVQTKVWVETVRNYKLKMENPTLGIHLWIVKTNEKKLDSSLEKALES